MQGKWDWEDYVKGLGVLSLNQALPCLGGDAQLQMAAWGRCLALDGAVIKPLLLDEPTPSGVYKQSFT